MRTVNSPHFKMYWQPNPELSHSENLEYIALLNPYITHVHVFNWTVEQRLELSDDIDVWKDYLSALSGDHYLLLEFMPDDRIQSLKIDAEALHTIIQSQNS